MKKDITFYIIELIILFFSFPLTTKQMQFSIHFIWKAKRVLNGMALNILPKLTPCVFQNVEKWTVFHLKLLIWRKIMHAFIIVLLYASWFCIMLSINVHLFTTNSIHPPQMKNIFHAKNTKLILIFLTAQLTQQQQKLMMETYKKAQRIKMKFILENITWKAMKLLRDAKGNLLQKT